MAHSDSNAFAGTQPLSATVRLYHPNFALDVIQVVFLVDGEAFKVDASHLASHSPVLKAMLFDATDLGVEKEGTPDNPIVVEGTTKETFAHFLGWMNHVSWENLDIDLIHGNLDVLHMLHLWEIREGYDYAIKELSKVDIHPAHRLHIARKYGVSAWFSSAITQLLRTPFTDYTPSHESSLELPTYAALACAKEDIQHARRQLSSALPFPRNMDSAPFCSTPETCKQIWLTVWVREIGWLVHNPRNFTPLCDVLEVFRSKHEHTGMHSGCKEYVLQDIENSPGFWREDAIIESAIVHIQTM